MIYAKYSHHLEILKIELFRIFLNSQMGVYHVKFSYALKWGYVNGNISLNIDFTA